MKSRPWLWNSHQRHKFLRAEPSRNILRFRVSEMSFPGVFKRYLPATSPYWQPCMWSIIDLHYSNAYPTELVHVPHVRKIIADSLTNLLLVFVVLFLSLKWHSQLVPSERWVYPEHNTVHRETKKFEQKVITYRDMFSTKQTFTNYHDCCNASSLGICNTLGKRYGSLYISGKLPTHPSPKPTLTLLILLT